MTRRSSRLLIVFFRFGLLIGVSYYDTNQTETFGLAKVNVQLEANKPTQEVVAKDSHMAGVP